MPPVRPLETRHDVDQLHSSANDVASDQVRPNGRPSACDQCRSRKVACDHQRPVCARCRKRKLPDSCTYSATVPRSYRTPPRSVKSSSSSIPGAHRSHASPTTRQHRSVTRPSTARSVASIARTPPATRHTPIIAPVYTTVASLNASRLMAKSYVLEESRNSLILLRGNSQRADAEAPVAMSRTCQMVPYESLPIILRDSCIDVLESLPGQANAQLAFLPKTHNATAWLYTAIERIIIHLTAMMARLAQEHGDRMLDALANELCYNTTRPFRAECPDADTWLEQFSGPKLRWESIALLWTHAEYYIVYELPKEERQVTWVEGKQSPEAARTYLGYCINIARHFTEGNELLLELCLRKAKIDSVLDGDSSMSAWESHGMAVTMMTFLGFHKKSNSPKKPTLCSEQKTRLAAQVFTGDKLEVIFTGLPPLLSRRYYSAPLPLGLSDEDLSADQATLDAAIARLDPDGWPRNGEVNRAVMVRARLMMAILRDEIIELAFSDSAYATIEQLLDLKQRQLGIMHRIPENLCYEKGDIMNEGQAPHTIFARILLRLEHLQNLFFIERLQLKQNASEDGALLMTSCQMTATVLEFWVHKSRLSELYDERDFMWLMLGFVALGSGIMCQELLRPTFHGQHPRDSSITRSSIIQQLSVLVTFLDWIYPSCLLGDGDLCKQLRDVIQRVLDHVLNGGNDVDLGPDMDWSFLEQVGLNNDFTSMVDCMPLNFLHPM